MQEAIREHSVVLMMLTGGLAGSILTLLFTHLRREKKRLNYFVTRNRVVERKDPDLKITYKGRSVECLDAQVVTVLNAGNRALCGLPVTIASPGGTILEIGMNPPKGAAHQLQTGPNQVTVTLDLLNPGEEVGIALLVADAPEEHGVDVIARAEHLIVRRSDFPIPVNIIDLLYGLSLGAFVGYGPGESWDRTVRRAKRRRAQLTRGR